MIQNLHNYEYPGTIKEICLQTCWKLKCESINDMGVLGFSVNQGWIQGRQGEGKCSVIIKYLKGVQEQKASFIP